MNNLIAWMLVLILKGLNIVFDDGRIIWFYSRISMDVHAIFWFDIVKLWLKGMLLMIIRLIAEWYINLINFLT